MASSGITHSSKTGFLRRKNVFFPVSSMRFMLPETIGISVLCSILALLLFSECILKITDYTRPEQIKTWRSDFQDYVSSLEFAGKIPGNYESSSGIYDENQEMIELGALDERIYQDTPVTSVSFSDNPHSRMYFKYRTGHVYTGKNWEALPEESYQNAAIFDIFSQIDYYPEEFLYHTAPGMWEMKVSLYNATDVLKKCVPYGFQKHGKITCHHDMITTETDTYLITSGADYETLFSNLKYLSAVTTESLLYEYCQYFDINYHDSIFPELVTGHENSKIWVRKNYWSDRSCHKICEAGILCGAGYSDFVSEQETTLPDTQAMQALRTVYADLFTDFNASTSSPAETIRKLQEIRNRICQDVNYTLSPGKTPANQDHAAYFLLENKQGYCEHYATAGTILARMAGIPARYCEGYMLDCSNPGTLQKIESESGKISFDAEILDSNAHAWTEIYLDGIGWIPFEFTFSYFTDTMTVITEPADLTELTESSEVTMTIAPDSEITEFSENSPENSLENSTEHASGSLTETNPRNLSGKWIVILSVLILSAIFCLITLIFRIVRLLALRRRAGLFAQDDQKAAAQSVYAYFTDLLSECGVHAHSVTIGELIEESEALCHEFMNSEQYSLSVAIQLGAKLRYSPRPLSNGERHYLQRTADTLAQGMYDNAKFSRRFYLRWLRHYV
ncbi:MAG: transglutaminase-like domain-containing protein [Oscillospiraceae bacterium]|nr:transglutaminase-like domain-containing protein [Oscillospiraceae bacterium]